jgi:hypothetical protein
VSTPIPVLAESAAWIVVDKPSGIATIPARDEDPALSLRHRLEAQLGSPLWVVHRIDRETSGVVAFARDAASHRLLNLAFQRQQVGKQYLAWTAGVPELAEGMIDVPLVSARKSKMRPAAPGETGTLASQHRLCRGGPWTLAGRTGGPCALQPEERPPAPDPRPPALDRLPDPARCALRPDDLQATLRWPAAGPARAPCRGAGAAADRRGTGDAHRGAIAGGPGGAGSGVVLSGGIA